jgi:hypothetical protein
VLCLSLVCLYSAGGSRWQAPCRRPWLYQSTYSRVERLSRDRRGDACSHFCTLALRRVFELLVLLGRSRERMEVEILGCAMNSACFADRQRVRATRLATGRCSRSVVLRTAASSRVHGWNCWEVHSRMTARSAFAVADSVPRTSSKRARRTASRSRAIGCAPACDARGDIRSGTSGDEGRRRRSCRGARERLPLRTELERLDT